MSSADVRSLSTLETLALRLTPEDTKLLVAIGKLTKDEAAALSAEIETIKARREQAP